LKRMKGRVKLKHRKGNVEKVRRPEEAAGFPHNASL
jgi:hypothetical protein